MLSHLRKLKQILCVRFEFQNLDFLIWQILRFLEGITICETQSEVGAGIRERADLLFGNGRAEKLFTLGFLALSLLELEIVRFLPDEQSLFISELML